MTFSQGMTEAEIEIAVSIIRHGLSDRVPINELKGRVHRALPAITIEDFAAAFERITDELVAAANRLRQFIKAQRA